MSVMRRPFKSRLNSNPVKSIIRAVSDERTHSLTDGRSFEERVFARFDALDASLDSVEERL